MTEFFITLHNINEKASLLSKLDNFDLKSVKDLAGIKGVLFHASESEAEKVKALPEAKAVDRWSHSRRVKRLSMNQFNQKTARKGTTNYTKDGINVNNTFAVLEENSAWAVSEGLASGNGGVGCDVIVLDVSSCTDNRPIYGNRLRRIDWRDYAPAAQRDNMYKSPLGGWGYQDEHGPACCATVGARGMGLAHKAVILPMQIDEVYTRDDVFLGWDVIKTFHEAKIAANVFRPTIVTISLGLLGSNPPETWDFDLIDPVYNPDAGLPAGTTKIHYQGADYPYSVNHAAGTYSYFHNFGVKPHFRGRSLSLSYNDPDTETQLYKDSLDELLDVPGVVLIMAAGNDSMTLVPSTHVDYDNYVEWGVASNGQANKCYYNKASWPGTNDKAIVVGALAATNYHSLTNFTGRGPRIDIYCPGQNGKAMANPDRGSYNPNGNLGKADDYREDATDMGGTSMASPFFAGALACLLVEKKEADGLSSAAWINAINPTYVRNIINTVSHDITPSDTADNTNLNVTNANGGSHKILNLGSASSIPFRLTSGLPVIKNLGFHPINTKAVKFYTNGENISVNSNFTQKHLLSQSLSERNNLVKLSEWGELDTSGGLRNAEMFSEVTGDWYASQENIAYLPNALNNSVVNKLIFNLNPATHDRPTGFSSSIYFGWDSSFSSGTKIEAGFFADYVDDNNNIEIRMTLYRTAANIDTKLRAYRKVNGNTKYYYSSNNIPNLTHAQSRYIKFMLSGNFFRGEIDNDRYFSFDLSVSDPAWGGWDHLQTGSTQPAVHMSAPQSLDGSSNPQGTYGLRVSTVTSGTHGPAVVFSDTELNNFNIG